MIAAAVFFVLTDNIIKITVPSVLFLIIKLLVRELRLPLLNPFVVFSLAFFCILFLGLVVNVAILILLHIAHVFLYLLTTHSIINNCFYFQLICYPSDN